ncbi:MAG: carbohydrate-binding domain-containing protein [bacterium]
MRKSVITLCRLLQLHWKMTTIVFIVLVGTLSGSIYFFQSPKVEFSGKSISTGSVVTIFAAGTRGNWEYPTMQLLIDGKVVKSFSNVMGNPDKRQFDVFTYISSSKISHSQVRVAFANDYRGSDFNDRNLLVDRIVLDGQEFQTESSDIASVGSWDSANGCGVGNKKSEWLHCNGYFQY